MKIFESIEQTQKKDVWKTEIRINDTDPARLQKIQTLLKLLKEKVIEKQ